MTQKIMCIGDSNTMGTDLLGGWRRPLHNLVPELTFVGSLCVISGDYTVGQHEGTSGATIETIISLSLANVDTYTPSVVLFMAGTNNASAGAQTASEMLTAYVTAAEQLLAKASVTKVIIGSIPPRLPASSAYAVTVAFNAGLAAAFASTSAGIVYYDVCGHLDTDDLEVDGIHLTTTGHLSLATDGWFPALRAELDDFDYPTKGTPAQSLWGYQ